MVTVDAVREGRACFERQAWRDAHERLAAADVDSRLEAEDLERLAACAHMLGNDAECTDLWERAHHAYQLRGDVERAALCAFRIGFDLVGKGMTAQGGGWLARARRLLDQHPDSVVFGYLLIPECISAVRSGNPARGLELFTEVLAIGERFQNRDLVTFARHGQGRALIKLGRTAEGVALMDEAMVAVTSGELSALHVGDIYCSVIDACTEIFDLRRAHEWTMALFRWCERQPEGIPYRGTCLVRRAEILQVRGAWGDALGEAERACERLLLPPPRPGAGNASYQCGELHRLRGEFTRAEEAYRRASELGRKPQPGLALMRLAQGDTDAALASVRRVVDESRDASSRSRVLPAYVEILLAAGDAAAARTAAAELRDIAVVFDAPFLRAMAAHCEAAVMLQAGDAEGAVGLLRESLDLWRELETPYEEARSRELMAVASHLLGDDDS